jgi:hypothetical protein
MLKETGIDKYFNNIEKKILNETVLMGELA